MITPIDLSHLRTSRLARGQAERLFAQVADGVATPRCPKCPGLCSVIRTQPRPDTPYVRRRIIVRCSRCRASCSVEIKGIKEGGTQR